MIHRPLTQFDLLPHGPLVRLGSRALLYESIDSTNAALLRAAATLPDGTLAAAEVQTAGRGRLGRRWETPRGAAVLLSVLLHEPAEAPLVPVAALLGALAACEGIAETAACEPRVRWPNDLVIEGRKVGGVLAETTALGERRALVIGLGINCLQHAGHFPPALREKATSLEMAAPHAIDRAAVAAGLLRRLDAWLVRAVQPGGVAEVLAAWRARCHDVGTHVTLEHNGRSFAGTAVDVTPEGDLIVQLDTGGRTHFAAAQTTRAW